MESKKKIKPHIDKNFQSAKGLEKRLSKIFTSNDNLPNAYYHEKQRIHNIIPQIPPRPRGFKKVKYDPKSKMVIGKKKESSIIQELKMGKGIEQVHSLVNIEKMSDRKKLLQRTYDIRKHVLNNTNYIRVD